MKIGKLTRFLAGLFAPYDYDTDTPPIWIADEWQAALIDTDSGRVLAHLWDDQHGKYRPTLFASPWRAVRLLKTQPCYVSSLCAFPRVTLQFLRLKVASLAEAQRAVEAILAASD